MRPTLGEQVRAASALLGEAGVPSPAADARALAAFVLKLEAFPAFEPEELPADFMATFAELVARRCSREPLQHIVGTAPFRYLSLQVRPGVFVPRPETEVVAQVAIDEAAALAAAGSSPLVIDLCCGAGGIAISVATEVPGARVLAMDAAPEAVALTAANAAAAKAAVEVIEADVADPSLWSGLDGTVDVVVANPPYIPPHQVPLDPEVRDHDPDLALYGGGEDGLDVPRLVIGAAARLLRSGGLFVMEHADVQGEQAREAARASVAFKDIETRTDLTGRDRMLVARRV